MGDRSGRETITRVTGGMKVKADRDLSLLLIKDFKLSLIIFIGIFAIRRYVSSSRRGGKV